MLGTAATQLHPNDSADATPQAEADRYALSARLLDSLLHDARNPLNALSINIEVLAEKLRLQAGGTIPATQEKNLKAMRDQIHRIDNILRLFAPYIAQTPSPADALDFSELVQKAAEVLGHESRRARVRISMEVTGGVNVRVVDVAALRFVVTRSLLAGLESQLAGEDLFVAVAVDRDQAHLKVALGPTPPSEGLAAVETFARQLGAEWSVSGREMRLSLPLA